MEKVIAVICVISWAGFWSFGYLAMSAEAHEVGQLIVASVLAAMGFLTGVFAYLRLSSGRPMKYRRVEQG